MEKLRELNYLYKFSYYVEFQKFISVYTLVPD
jgi:hypothetical protein